MTIILAGVLILSKESISSVSKTDNLLASAPTPYPTVSSPENYTVTQSDTLTSQTSNNIEVMSPISNDIVKPGFLVKGNARTADNNVIIRLSDSSGNILSETTSIANSLSTGNYGPFEQIIYFNSEDSSGKLDIFQLDKNDGSLRDIVTIPLKFR